ncbi:NADP-dependent oxidoreductase [Noviherbaspirillum saxi]|nr:NADP-dependent oxidoreductase [Noviherbaspirillum saxi]
MTAEATRIRLTRRPAHELCVQDFLVEQVTVKAPCQGEVLLRARYLSLDPYLARRMCSWDGPQAGAIVGRMIAEVTHSASPHFHNGDIVFAEAPWQDRLVLDAAGLRRVDVTGIAASAWLGVLGSSGITAWAGVRKIIAPRAGETLVVSAASGPVGSVAGQLARLAGARVIGIAGGAEKCRYVREHLRFDACVDHRGSDFPAALAAATPDGIDALFENVGANTLDPVLQRMNKGGRVALCGLFQHYQDENPVCLKHFRNLLDKAIRVQGFHVSDYAAEFDAAASELASCLRSDTLRHSETVTDGIRNAPQAFIDMLAGRGTGKHLVRVG